jgi:hypothetical protein
MMAAAIYAVATSEAGALRFMGNGNFQNFLGALLRASDRSNFGPPTPSPNRREYLGTQSLLSVRRMVAQG